MSGEWAGVFPALMTGFKEDGALDRAGRVEDAVELYRWFMALLHLGVDVEERARSEADVRRAIETRPTV